MPHLLRADSAAAAPLRPVRHVRAIRVAARDGNPDICEGCHRGPVATCCVCARERPCLALLPASRSDREAVLDAFAAELLLPSAVLAQERGTAEAINREDLIALAARYRTSWSLALRQAAHAGVLSAQARSDWGRSTPTRSEFMEAVGWAPQLDLEAIRVPPRYAHAVLAAWRKGALTATRAIELMHGQIAAADLPAGIEAEIEP